MVAETLCLLFLGEQRMRILKKQLDLRETMGYYDYTQKEFNIIQDSDKTTKETKERKDTNGTVVDCGATKNRNCPHQSVRSCPKRSENGLKNIFGLLKEGSSARNQIGA